ncbi:Hypothetical protein CPI37_1115 [Corynebacterium pseudotuberculosis]|nr:Hypothetical protein CPI37_1115 [Corynebacterium pseudotuberculosis]
MCASVAFLCGICVAPAQKDLGQMKTE